MENSMENSIILFVVVLIISIAVFLILRELVLWYFKVNTIIRNQQKTNELLQKIYVHSGGQVESTPASGQTKIDVINVDEWDDSDTLFVKTLNSDEKQYMTVWEWKDLCKEEPFFLQNHNIISVARAK